MRKWQIETWTPLGLLRQFLVGPLGPGRQPLLVVATAFETAGLAMGLRGNGPSKRAVEEGQPKGLGTEKLFPAGLGAE
jgi:hypothetical protein